MTTFADLNNELQIVKTELETTRLKLIEVEGQLESVHSSLASREHELRMAEVRETTMRSEVTRLEALVRGITDPLWDRLVVAVAGSNSGISLSPTELVTYVNDIIARRIGGTERVKMSKKNKSESLNPAT